MKKSSVNVSASIKIRQFGWQPGLMAKEILSNDSKGYVSKRMCDIIRISTKKHRKNVE